MQNMNEYEQNMNMKNNMYVDIGNHCLLLSTQHTKHDNVPYSCNFSHI